MLHVTIDKLSAELTLDLEASLQGYFFEQLSNLNQQSANPLPKESIVYTSFVMSKFCNSSEYFEISDGKVREKILGVKLLESSHLPKTQQETELKDIGDTALFLCGYFSDSLNKKLVAPSYYKDVGRIAYRKLDHFIPSLFEVPKFYQNLSSMFETISMMMNLINKQVHEQFDVHEKFILFNDDKDNLKAS
jgi:hypothetical protein